MTFDTTISLDIIIALVAIFGAVWRLDGKINDLRNELDGKLRDFRDELKGDNADSRAEFKSEIRRWRRKSSAWRTDVQRVETKVDDGLAATGSARGPLRRPRRTAGSGA